MIRERHWDKVRTYEKPEAYWFKIAGRRYRRIKGREAASGVEAPAVLLDTAMACDPIAQATLRMGLDAAFSQLPLRQRQVLWLREVIGYSTAETAGILGIKEGSVKTHLHHAKAKMRELLVDSIREVGIR